MTRTVTFIFMRIWVDRSPFMGIAVLGVGVARGQELGGAGTVQGTVKDPTGGVMVAVTVDISNPVSGFKRSATTDAAGRFVFRNLPPNGYHLAVGAQGFDSFERDVAVRSGVPIDVDVTLKLAGATSTVEVVGHAEDLLERDPTAHTDIDQSLMAKLSLESSSGLNQVITLASPGVVSDSNGFFHPIGDHAQTQFSIDNQPVTDQQSRVYSNQISPDAVQSMEVITGVAPGRVRRQEQPRRPHRDQVRARPVEADRQRVGLVRIVQEPVVRGQRRRRLARDRQLSVGERPAHRSLPGSAGARSRCTTPATASRSSTVSTSIRTMRIRFHLNLQAARSSFDIPNTIDQAAAGQAQHQDIDTFNVAPGYSRVIGSKTLLTVNGFVRQDRVDLPAERRSVRGHAGHGRRRSGA